MAANEPRLRGVRRPVTEREANPPWRVEGARPPDPKEDPPKRRSFVTWRVVAIFALLLGLNYYIVSTLPNRESRMKASYSLFVDQVNAGNVAEITSRADVIQGDFKKPVADPSPPKGEKAKTYARFETVVPSFANTDELSTLLTEKKVVLNAKALDQPRNTLFTLLISFGPTLLLIAIFVALARRAGGAAGAVSASAARARSATRPTPSARRSPTWLASRRPSRSWRRSSTSSATRAGTRGSAARSRRACCWPASPARARHCWRAPSRARPTCRTSPCRRRSSSR